MRSKESLYLQYRLALRYFILESLEMIKASALFVPLTKFLLLLTSHLILMKGVQGRKKSKIIGGVLHADSVQACTTTCYRPISAK